MTNNSCFVDETLLAYYNPKFDTFGNKKCSVCQGFCVNFLEVFVVFFHQRAKPFVNKQLVSNHRPIG